MSRSKSRKSTPAWAKYKNRKRLSRKGFKYSVNDDYQRAVPDSTEPQRKRLAAPRDFRLIDNTGGVVQYFNDVERHVQQGLYVHMDMSEIERTDLATISLLISTMMDTRRQGYRFKELVKVKIPPVGVEPRDLFDKAQFRETVTRRGIANHTFFLSRTGTKVNEKYINDILLYAENFVGEQNTRELAPILVEITSNTNNHASPESKTEKDKIPWFISIVEDVEGRRMIFSVVDLGIGIYESLKRKGLDKTLDSFQETITDIYSNSQSKFLSVNIPKGVDSSTGLFYRGKGLQKVHGLAQASMYNKFDIVTNMASVNMKRANQIRRDSGESLHGTVYYWEIAKGE